MKKIKTNLYYILLIFAALFSFNVCKEKYPEMNYLSPFDREHEGFLDPETYQVIGKGYPIPMNVILDAFKYYLPEDMPEELDLEKLENFNKNPLPLRLRSKLINFQDIIHLDLTSLPEVNINLSKIDYNLNYMTKVKKNLMEKACESANINALYRWFLLQDNQDYKNSEMHSDHAEISKSGERQYTMPLISGFDSYIFPPKEYYQNSNQKSLQYLEQKALTSELQIERIEDLHTNPNLLECTVRYHIKKPDLYLQVLHLKH